MSLNPNQLPVVVISGATRGLGKAAAEALARQNHHVIMLCRDVRDAADHAMGLSRAGFSVEPRKVDVGSSAEVASVRKHIEQEYGRVDVLINNAGILPESTGSSGDTAADPLRVSPTTVMQSFNVNTMGAMRLIQQLKPLMGEGGRIINVSSSMGQFGELRGNFLAYRLSKTALNALTAIYADALQEYGISVYAMDPGWVKTDMGGAQASLSVEQGIDTMVWLATSDAIPENGRLYCERQVVDW